MAGDGGVGWWMLDAAETERRGCEGDGVWARCEGAGVAGAGSVQAGEVGDGAEPAAGVAERAGW